MNNHLKIKQQQQQQLRRQQVIGVVGKKRKVVRFSLLFMMIMISSSIVVRQTRFVLGSSSSSSGSSSSSSGSSSSSSTTTTSILNRQLRSSTSSPYKTGAFVSSFANIVRKQQKQQKSASTTVIPVSFTSRPSSFVTNQQQRSLFGLSTTLTGSTTSGSSSKTTSRLHSTVSGSGHDEELYDYDYFVIGGGSGGIASARRAATYGAKVAVAEGQRLGGTCVNVGCVPKKVMWNAAHIAEILHHDMKHYGYTPTNGDSDTKNSIQFDWNYLKTSRDKYIERLNGIYDKNLQNSNVTVFPGYAAFDGLHTVTVTPIDGSSPPTKIRAKHILIAVGGKPLFPTGEGIAEHSISSDGFFELETLPKKTVVVGAGYIAVELAGVLQALGSETHLVVRKDNPLRSFDTLIVDTLNKEMIRQGIEIHRNTNGLEKITYNVDTKLKTVYLQNGEIISDVDTVLVAPGRIPNTEKLQLDKVNVQLNDKGYIVVDDYCETNVPNVYALGDVIGKIELTPTAIAAGRRLADRLFGNIPNAKITYDLVPTVVFSHPPIGTIGLTEQQAIKQYGAENVKVYTSTFANLFYGIYPMEYSEKPKTSMKLVCMGPLEHVVGLHVIGMGADEMTQGFGIAMRMNATKADFDATIAIHPTAAEEFVTMAPWGLSPPTTTVETKTTSTTSGVKAETKVIDNTNNMSKTTIEQKLVSK